MGDYTLFVKSPRRLIEVTGECMLQKFVVALVLTISPWTVLAHGANEPRVDIEPESATSTPAGNVDYTFDLVDNVDKRVLTDKDLAVDMEKLLHFIAYDSSLIEFQHVHPAFLADGKWHVQLNFSKSGHYWLWAQGLIAKGNIEFAASSQLEVTSGSMANPLPPDLKESRSGSDGISVATLSQELIHSKKPVMLMLHYSRNDGSAPAITPYLGAKAHVTAVSDDGDSMIHIHPMNTSVPNELMIHAVFPAAGLYRVWIEFIDAGILRRAALVIEVAN
jgi:hypothetical protein